MAPHKALVLPILLWHQQGCVKSKPLSAKNLSSDTDLMAS